MRFVPSIAASAVAVSVVVLAGAARAQEASPTGKGAVGGALLGAELVLSIEAAMDVQSTWAYVGGGLGGAVAGGVGGYFVESESSTGRVPMLMLAAGMAFAIPTTIAVLSTTAYKPPADFVQDQQPTDEPVADPPQPGTPPPTPIPPPATGSKRTRTLAHRRALPPALIDVDPGQVTLSVPTVALYDVFTRAEVAELGVSQATEVRIPVLNVVF